MAMTFLQLCQRLRLEAGISGSGPLTVENQTGDMEKIVSWVQRAWVDIQQSRPNWNFMWAQSNFNTDIGTRDYAASDKGITDFALWDKHSFLIYETAVGESDENELDYWTYARWRESFRSRMNERSNDRPQLLTILPDKKVRFEPRPDKIYTINFDYKKTAQVMTLDAHTPTNLPDDFHMIIVWRALMYYGSDENAPEKLDQAETEYDSLLDRLEAEELPEMSEDYMALA